MSCPSLLYSLDVLSSQYEEWQGLSRCGGERGGKTVRMCHDTIGVLADLFNGIYSDHIPHLLGNGAEEFLVYRCDVEALAPCYVIVPLSSDFGLVCNENPFAVGHEHIGSISMLK